MKITTIVLASVVLLDEHSVWFKVISCIDIQVVCFLIFKFNFSNAIFCACVCAEMYKTVVC